MDEKFGLLLDYNRLNLLLECVHYRAVQLGQEMKASGKEDSMKKIYLRNLIDMRDELTKSAQSMAGSAPEGAIIIEGEKA